MRNSRRWPNPPVDATTRMWLRYQLCSGSICRPPAELKLPLTDDVRR